MENNILLTTKTHFFTLDDKVLLFGVCLFVVNLSIPTFRAVVHFPRLPRRLHVSRSCHWYEGNGSSSICDWLIITSTSPYTVTWSVSFKTGIGKPPKMPSSQSVLVCFSREKKIWHFKLSASYGSHFHASASFFLFCNDRLHPSSRCTIVNVSSVYLRLVCLVLFVPQVSI